MLAWIRKIDCWRKPENGVADSCIEMRLEQKLVTLYSLDLLFSPPNMAGYRRNFQGA